MPLTSSSPRIAYETHGTSGTPVLLVMGFGMRGSMWQPQLSDLSKAHRLATFDHRGLGDSEGGPKGLSMALMASDALSVADAAGFSSMHVVGISMGGMIAQHIALSAGRRVRSLTLIATQPGGPLAWVPTLKGVSCFVRAQTGKPTSRMRAFEELLYPRAFLDACDRAALEKRMAGTVSTPAPTKTRLAQLGAVFRHDARSQLGSLRMPTLIIRPGKDVLIAPKHSDLLAELIPHAEVMRVEDAGHGLIFQSAAQINPRLLDHFSKADRALTDEPSLSQAT